MAIKAKARTPPRIDGDVLTDNFSEQLGSGVACDAEVDLAAVDLTGCFFERVEIEATRLSGAALAKSASRASSLECKLDLLFFRMADFSNASLNDAT